MTLIDQATDIRTGEELDAQRIDAWLKVRLPELSGAPVIRQFPGGASNLTYLIRYPECELVLRRPPFGQKARSAHDMGREFRILNGLRDAFPYCPRALALCDDDALIGSPFYVMERLNGVILREDLPASLGLDNGGTEALCKNFIDRLVELHKVNYQACGLSELGRPDGYVRRQVTGWSERYTKALTPDAPRWESVMRWLAERMPADHPRPCIVHNDYRFDNVVLDPENPLRIVGVLDWEMATLGDPLMDLGNTLAYWIQADDPEPVRRMRRQPSHMPGMLTRRQFVDYYARQAGQQIDDFDFYYAFGLFRLAGIVQQIYYRFYHGQTRDKRFAPFVHMNALLERMTLRVIEGSAF